MPLTLTVLGTDRYGLWMAMTALTGMATFADLGLGNGLMTKLSANSATGDSTRARNLISEAYSKLSVLSLAGLGAVVLSFRFVPWADILGAEAGPLREFAPAVAVACLVPFLLNIPASLILRVQFAYQRVSTANLWQAAGGLASLLNAVLAVHLDLPDAWVICAASSGPLLVNALNGLWFFGWRHPDLRPLPKWRFAEADGSLMRLGGKFLVLTIVTSIALNIDNLLVAHALGPDSVTQFSVPAKMLTLLGLTIALVNSPLWPANGEALARGDVQWVVTVARRMTALSSCIVGAMGLALIILADPLMRFLSQGTVPASRPLIASLGLWWLVVSALSPTFMIQNAMGIVRPQLIGWLIFLAVSVPAKYLVARHIGLAAIPLVGASTYVLTVLPFAAQGARRALQQAAKVAND